MQGQEQKQFVKIEIDKMNAVLKYLATRPYGEVADLIAVVKSGQVLPPEPEVVKDEESKED